MNTEKKPTVGRIVHYYPGTLEQNKLPNNMEFAPAIITQVWDAHCNMTIFTADPDVNNTGVIKMWSIPHKESEFLQEGGYYWDWASRDKNKVNYPQSEYNSNLRYQMQNWTPIEQKIYDLIQEVEKLGADPILTDAVCLLGQAKQAVAKWIIQEYGENYKPVSQKFIMD